MILIILFEIILQHDVNIYQKFIWLQITEV